MVCASILLFGGCGNGSSSSGATTSIASYGVTVDSSLLQNGQTYTVEIDSYDSDVTIYGTCTTAGTTCTTQIPANDFVNNADDVNVRVTQNGSLIAADTLYEPSQTLTLGGGATIKLDEYTTGEYILDDIQLMNDEFMPDEDAQNDLAEFYGIDSSSAEYYITVPVMAYYMLKEVQGSSSYSTGLYNVWFALYGDPNDFSSLEQTTTTKDAQSPTTPVTSISKTGVANKLSIGEKDDNSGTKPKEQTGLPSGGSQFSAPLKGDVLTNITSADSQKAIVALTQKYVASVGIPAVSDETKETLKIVKDVSTIAFGTLNMVYPGLGSLVNAISGGVLDSLIGKPDDPNKPMIEAMGKIEQAVDRVSANMTSIHADNLKIEIGKQSVSAKDARIKIESFSKGYYNLMQERGIKPTEAEASKKDFVMASIIDKKLAQKAQEGDAQFNAEVAVIKQWFTKAQVENMLDMMTSISSDENIKLIFTTVNAAKNTDIKSVTDNVNKLNASGVDLDMNSRTNILSVHRGGVKKLIDYEVGLLGSFEQARTLHLAAAYLKYKSPYRKHFEDIKVDIPNFSYHGATYEEVVKVINEYYLDKMYKVLSGNVNKYVMSLIGGSDITASDYAGMYQEPRAYFDLELLKTQTSGRSWCGITYWDSKNLGYRCEVANSSADGIRYKDFYIGNISSGVCKSRIKQATSSDPLYDHRYYCDTDLRYTHQNKVNYIDEIMYNDMKKAWIKVSDSGSSIFRRGDNDRAYLYSDNPDKYPGGVSYDVTNGKTMDGPNLTDSSSALRKVFAEAVNYTWNTRQKNPGWILTGPVMATGYAGAPSDRTTARARMDVTETYKGIRNYVIIATWDRFNGVPFKESGSLGYSTLGCITSDCWLVKATNSEAKIAFDSGWTVSLTPNSMYDNVQGLTTLSRKHQKEAELKPAGDWEQYCKSKAPIIIRNGWIKAKCGNPNNVGVNDAWSFLNYKQCAPGSEVTLNASNQLACK